MKRLVEDPNMDSQTPLVTTQLASKQIISVIIDFTPRHITISILLGIDDICFVISPCVSQSHPTFISNTKRIHKFITLCIPVDRCGSFELDWFNFDVKSSHWISIFSIMRVYKVSSIRIRQLTSPWKTLELNWTLFTIERLFLVHLSAQLYGRGGNVRNFGVYQFHVRVNNCFKTIDTCKI